MTPIDQTTFGGPGAPLRDRGDCFSAALASILNLPLWKVPRFCEGPEDDWIPAVNRFLLAEECDLAYVQIAGPGEGDTWHLGLGWHLICGPGPRGGVRHAVVGFSGEIIWDPHPSRAGLDCPVEERSYGLLVARFARGSHGRHPDPALRL